MNDSDAINFGFALMENGDIVCGINGTTALTNSYSWIAGVRGSGPEDITCIGGDFDTISHTKGAVLAAAGSTPVGADIQRIMEKDFEGVAKRVMKPEELSLITRSKSPEREFARLWTLKESYVKFTGEGISALEAVPDLSAFEKNGGSLPGGPSFVTEESEELFISVCSNDTIEVRETGLDEVLRFLY